MFYRPQQTQSQWSPTASGSAFAVDPQQQRRLAIASMLGFKPINNMVQAQSQPFRNSQTVSTFTPEKTPGMNTMRPEPVNASTRFGKGGYGGTPPAPR